MYSKHTHKGSHSCLGEVPYALGANDRGVTGAWESFVPLTPLLHQILAANAFFQKQNNFKSKRAPLCSLLPHITQRRLTEISKHLLTKDDKVSIIFPIFYVLDIDI